MRVVVRSEYLRAFFDSISALVTESRVKFGENGIRASAINGTGVAMVVAEIPKEAFEEYSTDRELVVGVDVEKLSKVMKSCSGNVEMAVDGEIRINTKEFSYSVSVIDPSVLRAEPKSTDLKFTAEFSLKAGELRNAISTVSRVSGDIVIRTDDSGVHIEAKSDVDRISISFPAQDLPEARSMYDAEYIKNFFKAARPEDTVTVQMGTKYPAKFSMKLFGGKVLVEYLLAPKIEPE
jgi:proliferating cell nuclear antigen